MLILQASDTAWEFALNNSKKNYINLDIGHYIAARKENTKETLLNFILKNHSRICSLHLKDRQAAKTFKCWSYPIIKFGEKVILLLQKFCS